MNWTWNCREPQQQLSLILVLTAIISSTATTGHDCKSHFSVSGYREVDLAEKDDTLIIKYHMKRGRDEYVTHRYLYSIWWDEYAKPTVVSRDLSFSKFFEIKERNSTWRVFAKDYSSGRPSEGDEVKLSSIFGPFSDTLTCKVTLNHRFTFKEEESDRPNMADGLRGLHDDDRQSFSLTWEEDDDNDPTSDSTVSVDPNKVTTQAYSTTGDATSSYRVTVGIIGGILGLLFLIGVGAGLYYNYKRGLRFGIIRRKPSTQKNISILGSAYPNIALSTTDIRPNSTEYDATNYAYANPAAVEEINPPQYQEKII